MLGLLCIEIFIDTYQTFSVMKPLLQVVVNLAATDYSQFVTL